MSVNIPTHYVQQYSTNIALLLQQQGSKLRDSVSVGSYVGKQSSPVDQIGKVEMQTVTSRFAPMNRVDAPTDRRWVIPSLFFTKLDKNTSFYEVVQQLYETLQNITTLYTIFHNIVTTLQTL